MAKPLPLPFGGNRLLESGRTVLFVVAHESIVAGRERPVKDLFAPPTGYKLNQKK